MFADGGTPKVITLGSGYPYTIRRIAHVPYVEDPATGHRLVEMDQAFVNDLMPAMAQQGVQVQWVVQDEATTLLRELATLTGVEPHVGLTEIMRAAVTQLRQERV